MAIRPSIPLQAQVANPNPGIAQLANLIQQGKQNQVQQEQLQMQREQMSRQKELQAAQIAQVWSDIQEKGQARAVKEQTVHNMKLLPLLDGKRTPEAIQLQQERIQSLEQRGLDTSHSVKMLEKISANPEIALADVNNDLISATRLGLISADPSQGSGMADTTKLVNAELAYGITDQGPFVVEVATNKRLTGQEAMDRLDQAMKAEADREVEAKKRAADISVDEKQRKERATQTEKRISELTGDINARARNAAASRPIINEALIVANQASQGLAGVSKVQMSRLFPGIDVSNEAILEANMLRLALEQLQSFKGPTTDFEFGVTQSIAGDLADGRSANIARLNSAARAAWFAEENKRQYDQWVQSGKDPETFVFSMDVPAIVNGVELTHKGQPVKLRDLQDTAVENHLTIEDVINGLQ